MKPKQASSPEARLFLDSLQENMFKNSWIGCVDSARLFIKSRKNLKPSDVDTALLISTERHNNYLVKYFCLQQADVDCCDRFNNTPLHIATKNGDEHIAQCLIEMGARTNIINAEGKTALDIIAEKIQNYDEHRQSVSAPKLKTLENIKILLQDPESYRKNHQIISDPINSIDLETILESEQKIKREAEARRARMEEARRNAEEAAKREKEAEEAKYSEKVDSDSISDVSDEEMKIDKIPGRDVKPARKNSLSLLASPLLTEKNLTNQERK